MPRRNLLVPAGIAALGIAAGLLAERIIVGRQVRYDADAEEDQCIGVGWPVAVAGAA